MAPKKRKAGVDDAFDATAQPGESTECETLIILSHLTGHYEHFSIAPLPGVKGPAQVTGHDFSDPMSNEMRMETYDMAYSSACTFKAHIFIRFEAGKILSSPDVRDLMAATINKVMSISGTEKLLVMAVRAALNAEMHIMDDWAIRYRRYVDKLDHVFEFCGKTQKVAKRLNTFDEYQFVERTKFGTEILVESVSFSWC